MITVVIQNNPFCGNSAASNRWRTLLEGLSDLSVDIKVLIYGGFSSTKEKSDWGIEGKYNSISYRYLSTTVYEGFIRPRINFYLGDLWAGKIIKKKILPIIDNKTEIVWTDSSMIGLKLAVFLKKRALRGKIFLEMNEYPDFYKYSKHTIPQKIKYYVRQKFLENKAFHAYDGLALMTKSLVEYYNRFPEPKPQLLHLPMTVDLDRFSEEKPCLNDFIQPYIAFVGVMNDAKDGVSLLIKAFAQISREFPKYKLYLVGPWHYDTPIHQKLIETLNLKDRVFWVGEYPRDQIPSILKNAELLVLPRPDSKQAQGGFPTKLGEYLATGNPVCATMVGEIPDYLVDGESVFFATPGSVESFAQAMRRALVDPENAKLVGHKGRKVAEKFFNKTNQAKQLHDFLINLLASNQDQ